MTKTKGPFRVVITDFVKGDLSPELKILGDIATVEALDVTSEAALLGRIENADAIMLFHSLSVGADTLNRLTNCKLVVRCGVGYDNVNHTHAATRGIPVANVPDYGTEDVADAAIGLTLTLARGIHQTNSKLRDGRGQWSYKEVAPLRRLRGQVFGIVGLGRIGTATAQRAKALGMDVVFYDPHKPEGYDKALGIRRARTLADLLQQSVVLSLHCPLTDETRNLINAETIALMPKGSFLINTARGGVVDTSAVPKAIATGQLAGVGLDVLPVEPPLADDPLIMAWRNIDHPAHDRLVITPHSAFYSEDGLMDMRCKGAEACRRALLGEAIPNVVNR
jgi:C-terminal binding protein